jgi:oxygen-dependent protoporphyrinogen oxidase
VAELVVIGAGPAGCAAGRALTELGHQVTLIESEPRVGGRTWTLREDGFSIDTGAVTLAHFYRRTLALARSLGRSDEIVRFDRVAGFHDGSELHPLRMESPPSYMRLGLLGLRDKARIAARSLRASLRGGPDLFELDSLVEADRGETIAQWGRRSFGEAGYEYVVRPNIEPLWSFSCEDASAALQLALLRVSRGRGVRLMVPRRGVGSVCEWLAEGLQVRAGTKVMRLEVADRVLVHADSGTLAADGVVIATDATTASGLVPAGPARAILEQVPYAANVHVAFGFAEDPWPEFPTDIVVPVGSGERAVTSVELLSRRSESLVPEGAQVVDVYIGDRAARRLTDAEAAAEAHDAVNRYLGAAPPPAFEHVFRRERAFPVPVPGGYSRMREALSATPSRVRLAGDYLSHAMIEAAIRSGERAARELHSELV